MAKILISFTVFQPLQVWKQFKYLIVHIRDFIFYISPSFKRWFSLINPSRFNKRNEMKKFSFSATRSSESGTFQTSSRNIFPSTVGCRRRFGLFLHPGPWKAIKIYQQMFMRLPTIWLKLFWTLAVNKRRRFFCLSVWWECFTASRLRSTRLWIWLIVTRGPVKHMQRFTLRRNGLCNRAATDQYIVKLLQLTL